MPVGGAITIGSAALGVLEGGLQTVQGFGEEKRTKRELARLQKPYYKIQDEYFQNRNVAGVQAGQGMTSTAKDYLTTESERGVGANLAALTQLGGSPNDAAKLFDSYYNTINRTAAQDSEAQLNNIKYFIDQNSNVAKQKQIQWAVNEYQPYQAKLKELTERRAAAKQNEFGGLTTAVGSLSALGTAVSNQYDDEKGSDPYPTRVFQAQSANPALPTAANPAQAELQNKNLYAPKSFVEDAEYSQWWNSLSPQEQSQNMNNFYGR